MDEKCPKGYDCLQPLIDKIKFEGEDGEQEEDDGEQDGDEGDEPGDDGDMPDDDMNGGKKVKRE